MNSFPTPHPYYYYFIEQQLATGPPVADWTEWWDSRAPGRERTIIQIPKFWSHGMKQPPLAHFFYELL